MKSKAKETARVLKILSVGTRVRIVQLLKGRALCVNALAHRLKVTQGAVSQHLRLLRDAGLVVDEKRGYYVHYRLNEEVLAAWREAIEQAGLLDATFFMYGEDLDWAFRIKQHNWSVWYNPAVTVLHIKEAASKHSKRARYEFYRAMVIFYRKHYAAQTPRWLHWLILGYIAVRCRLDLWGRALRSWLVKPREEERASC